MNQSLALRQKMRTALLSTTGVCVASLLLPGSALAVPVIDRVSNGQVVDAGHGYFYDDVIVENAGSRLHGNEVRFINAGQLTIDDHGRGDFQYLGLGNDALGGSVLVTNGGQLHVAQDLVAGYGIGGYGTVTVDGAGSLIDVGGDVALHSFDYTESKLVISNGGRVDVAGTIYLNSVAGGRSSIWIGSGLWSEQAPAGVLNAPRIDMGLQSGLIFNHTGTFEYDGSITGTGYVNVVHGHAILSGDSSDFGGYTYYNSETLEVNGHLGGNVNLGNGNLRGTGTVERVVLSAVLSGVVRPQATTPTIGTLDIGVWSYLNVEVDPELNRSGTFNVSGRATIGEGAELHHILGRSSNYRRSSRFVVINAAGGVEGRFEVVGTEYAFLDISLDYTDTQVIMNLDRNDIRFTDIAQTPNQLAVASAIEDITASENLSDLVVDLSEDEARLAFTQMAGDLHVSARSAMLMDAANLRHTLVGSVANNAASGQGYYGWGRVLSSASELDARGENAALKSDTTGFMAGVDKGFGDAIRAGVVVGFEKGEMKSAGLGQIDRDSQHLGLYGRGDWGNLNIQAGAIASWHALSSRRDLAFGTTAESLKGDYDATSEQVFVEAAWAVPMAWATVSPYAMLAHDALDVDGVDERGGVAALSVASKAQSLTTAGLGMGLDKSWVRANGRSATVSARVGWESYSGDLEAVQTVAFADSAEFAINGLPMGDEAMVGRLGLAVPIGKAGTVSLDWNGAKGSDQSRNAFTVGYRLSF